MTIHNVHEMQVLTISEKEIGRAIPVLELIHKYANQYAKCQEKGAPCFVHGMCAHEREGEIG